MLLKLKRQGITILVSTPYMDEASLCDRIALVQAGEFLQVDTPRSVVSRYPAMLLAVRSGKMHQLLGDLRDYPYVNTSFSFGTAFHVLVRHGVSRYAARGGLSGSVARVPRGEGTYRCGGAGHLALGGRLFYVVI